MNKKSIIISIVAIVLLVVFGIIFYPFNNKDNNDGKNSAILFDGRTNLVGESLIEQQRKVDEEIKGYQNNKDITIENAKVLPNPYKISPLTALIIFYSSDSVSVTLEINDGEKIKFDSAKHHTIPVYGLLSNYNNKVKITTSDNKSKTYTLKTEDVTQDLPAMEVNEASKTLLTNDIYIFTTPQVMGTFGYDVTGAIRWYIADNFGVAPIVLENGNLLLGNGVQRDGYTSQTGFIEINILGKIINEYISEEGYHHDIIQKNGNYIFIGNNPSRKGYLDYIVEMDKKGKIVKSFDINEIVTKVDNNFVKELDSEVWAWINSVFYDKKTDSLIISLRGRNSVISVDYKTSSINWIFGDKEFWSSSFESYILEPEAGLRMPLGQHSAFITESGALGLFDNGYDASDPTYSAPCSELKSNYSSANLYEINGKKIKQVSEFNDQKNMFSFALSNFRILANKNRLILSGWEFASQDYEDQSCEAFANMNLSSRIYEFDDKNNLLFDARLDEGTYRTEKMSLYTNNTKKFNISAYTLLGADFLKLSEADITGKTEELTKSLPIDFIHDSSSTFMKIMAYYPEDTQIKILFASETGKSYEYIIKKKGEMYVRNVYTGSLKGNYHIYLIWDGEYFDTNEIIQY